MTAVGLGVVLAAGEGRRVRIGPDVMTVKGDGQEDRFSIAEYEAAAGAPGPPPHIHHGNEEAFYIFEGEGRARWVGIFSPGRYRQLVEELGPLLPADGAPHRAEAAELFARYDTQMVEA
jgi:hypothetical protein